MNEIYLRQKDHVALFLFRASVIGKPLIVKQILNEGFRPEWLDEPIGHGELIINCAVRNGQNEILKLLINHGVSIDLHDHKGYTALHLAILNNDLNIVDILLRNGSKCLPDNEGNTPLHYAAKEKDIRLLEKCLEYFSDSINCKNSIKQTPLHTAVCCKRYKVASLLLKSGSSCNVHDKDKRSPLHVAVQYDDEQMVKMLIEHQCNINEVDYKGYTPLMYACCYGYKGVAAMLIRAGGTMFQSGVNEQPFLPLAVNNCASILVNTYTSWLKVRRPLFQVRTMLHMAAVVGDLNSVSMLLSCGTDPNVVDSENATPLFCVLMHLNITQSELHIFKMLIRAGTDLNLKGRFICLGEQKYWTPLELACAHNHQTVLRLLVAAGVQMKSFKEINWIYEKLHRQTNWLYKELRKPMSLLSLSRKAIRKTLDINPLQKIHSLPIPTMLKDYIDFKDLDDIL